MLGIEPALRKQFGVPGGQTPACVRLAELLWDSLRRVVEVAAPVGPADVVHEQQRQRRIGLARRLGQHLQLVIDGVPVVVAVDEGRVHRRQAREHVVAQRAVEVVAAAELALLLARVEHRQGIDHVQLRLGPEVIEQHRGGLSPKRPDLDDPSRAGGPQNRSDGNFVESSERHGLDDPTPASIVRNRGLERPGDGASRPKPVDYVACGGRRCVAFDHDLAAERDPVVKELEHLTGGVPAEVQQGDLRELRIGDGLPRGAIDDAHAPIEQTGSVEAGSCRLARYRGRSEHPNGAGPQLVGLDVCAHEHCCKVGALPAADEVACDRCRPDRIETELERVEVPVRVIEAALEQLEVAAGTALEPVLRAVEDRLSPAAPP